MATADLIPRPEFPRPDFLRENWESLNGVWEFDFDKNNEFENEDIFLDRKYNEKITVPFCYQAKMSGIGREADCPVVWYRRNFNVKPHNGRVILHFGAVDYEALVWLNGHFIGRHTGGYTGFSFDITNYINENENVLTVKALDYKDTDKPRGKQSWTGSKFGCWYTPVTGIWQSVWLEYVGDIYFTKVKVTPDVDRLQALCEVFLSGNADVKVRVCLNFQLGEQSEELASEITVKEGYGKLVFSFRDYDIRSNMLFWTPNEPNLIDVTAQTVGLENNDKVQTYFGMRQISVVHGRIMLNNHNLYQRLVLDQGYWPDSLLTPPSDQAIIDDIKLTKALGFNGARKHQKIEDPRYYYWADKLGLLVWGEMPSAYEFNDSGVKNTTNDMMAFIERDYNHPSIISWVTINESWGVREILSNKQQQDYARMLYYLVKAFDQTRLVSSNDGWEQVEESDICAIHDYALFAENPDKYNDMNKVLYHSNLHRMPYAKNNDYKGQPVLMTEYGGIAFASSGEEGWGYYGKVKNEEEFFARLEPVTNMLAKSGIFCGFCYTQLTDVMQEVNGLLAEDRKPKVKIEKLSQIFGRSFF